VATLAGGAEALVERALALAEQGRYALACHLVDWAAAAEPESVRVHAHVLASTRRGPGCPTR